MQQQEEVMLNDSPATSHEVNWDSQAAKASRILARLVAQPFSEEELGVHRHSSTATWTTSAGRSRGHEDA